ncbi:MAG: hypothetical protein KDB88_03660 [Flavobacteriales bacterium]|nr:hypothetical protein [Flavobacteriales bacterium]
MSDTTLMEDRSGTVRNVLIILPTLLMPVLLEAQDIQPFHEFNARRVQISQRATWVLGGWAAANLGAGALVRAGAEPGSEAWHFGNMTMGWSAINLGIAVPGLLALHKEASNTQDIPGTFKAQRRTETLYLINTGLDLGYMGLGLWMQERGLRTTGEDGARLRGFGNAILVQGAFLFAYDLVAYVAHSVHWKKKREGLFSRLQFNGTSLLYQF